MERTCIRNAKYKECKTGLTVIYIKETWEDQLDDETGIFLPPVSDCKQLSSTSSFFRGLYKV